MRLALLERLILSLPPLKRFLEIGPGRGDVSLFLADTFDTAIGDLAEISEESAAVIEERTFGQDRLTLLVQDFRDLDRCQQYDLIIACEVFEHIKDDEEAFQAVSELMAPGGYFIFSAPSSPENWRFADDYAGHFRRYSRPEVCDKFQRHGLNLLALWSYGFPVTHMMRPLSEYYYRRKLQEAKLEKLAATKRSGYDRSLALQFRNFPLAPLMRPFFLLQHLFKETDIGDGYIILGKKND